MFRRLVALGVALIGAVGLQVAGAVPAAATFYPCPQPGHNVTAGHCYSVSILGVNGYPISTTGIYAAQNQGVLQGGDGYFLESAVWIKLTTGTVLEMGLCRDGQYATDCPGYNAYAAVNGVVIGRKVVPQDQTSHGFTISDPVPGQWIFRYDATVVAQVNSSAHYSCTTWACLTAGGEALVGPNGNNGSITTELPLNASTQNMVLQYRGTDGGWRYWYNNPSYLIDYGGCNNYPVGVCFNGTRPNNDPAQWSWNKPSI